MAATTTAVPEAPKPIGAAGRMVGVLVSPRETFADIARRPSWLAPLLLLILLSVAITAIFSQRVGWRGVIEKQDAQNATSRQRMAQMTPEKQEQFIERQAKLAPIFGYVGGVLGFPIVSLAVAGIFLGIFNGFSNAGLNFKTSLGIVTHAYMPYVITSLLAILILFLKPPDQVDIQNLVASNAGAFLSGGAPKWLETLSASLDLFTFWALALMAFGFSIARPKKVSMASGLAWIVGLWVIYVVARVSLAAMFS